MDIDEVVLMVDLMVCQMGVGTVVSTGGLWVSLLDFWKECNAVFELVSKTEKWKVELWAFVIPAPMAQ